MKLIILTIAAISLGSFTSLKAQTKHDLDLIDSNHFYCINAAIKEYSPTDTGWGRDCEASYERSLDSLEAFALKHLNALTPLVGQHSLKLEDLKWNKKRDAYYKKLYWRDDEHEEHYKENFVKKRILYLIRKIKTLETHTQQ